MSYSVNGIPITNLILNDTNFSATQYGFSGFPTGHYYGHSIGSCLNFGFTYKGEDIGPLYRAKQYSITNNAIVDLRNADNIFFKHLNGLAYGGGGGAGGFGGTGWTGGSTQAGKLGGYGGIGGFGYIYKQPIQNYSIIYGSVGTGGNVGADGGNSNKPQDVARNGKDGDPGGNGNATYVNGDSVTLFIANGGGGGVGGFEGRKIGSAGNGGNGNGTNGGHLGERGNFFYDGNWGLNGGPYDHERKHGTGGGGWIWLTYEK